MVIKLIKDVSICLCVAIICAFLMFNWAALRGGLNPWMLVIFGLAMSSIHIFTKRTTIQFLKFIKLATPILGLFILSYMVYVEFNYPKTAELLELNTTSRGVKFLSELTKSTILNFLPRFATVLSLKLLLSVILGFVAGTLTVKHFKYEGFIKQLFKEEPLEDGNLVKKHTKRKSKKFGRRF